MRKLHNNAYKCIRHLTIHNHNRCRCRGSWSSETIPRPPAESDALESGLRCSRARPCKQQVNALQLDGPVAVVRNAGPVAVTPVGWLEMTWMGLCPPLRNSAGRRLLSPRHRSAQKNQSAALAESGSHQMRCASSVGNCPVQGSSPP